MPKPNILLIMTDEERYPPPYEDAAVAEFRRAHLPARERIRNGGVPTWSPGLVEPTRWTLRPCVAAPELHNVTGRSVDAT